MANRALLIGLNHYPSPRNNLQSCIADTLVVKQLLQDYGFSDDDIRVLHDEQATLANARDGLDWLFTDATADDHLVFYESSHGYRYAKEGTMVEVLCLYDQFLEDKELSSRTQALPPGVLTVILDACHSGGMNKLFFPDGQVQVARIKVFQPDPEQAEQDAKAIQAVTQFKFFGHAPSGDPGVVAKAFAADPGIPVAKEGSDLELNGLLFAACRAEQTALDGSPATNGNSAFTFSLIKSHHLGIGSTELLDHAEQQLIDLNLQQTPLLEAPAQQPDLVLRSFITMQELRKDSQPMTQTQLGDLTTIAQQIANEMKSHNGAKSFTTPSGDDQYWGDVINFASLLTPALAQATASKKGFHTKALTVETFALADAGHLQDKAWWNDVLAVVQQVTPVVIGALSGGKEFQAQSELTDVRPEHLQDKAWWNDVLNIVTQTTPYILNAINGSKDFKVGSAAADAPAITVSSEHMNDKSWWSDALKVGAKLAPLVIAAM
jgi:Caspase domain